MNIPSFLLESFLNPSWKKYLLFILLPIGVYYQTIWYPFSPLDDNGLIVSRIEWLRDISSLRPILFEPMTVGPTSGYYRPVLFLTFMADALIGNGNPAIFHLTNILLHITATILVFLFFRILLQSEKAALILSLLFALHPLNIPAVAWIPGRNDILLAITCLGAFISFLKYIQTNKQAWLVLHILFLLITFATKETGIMLFPLLFLYYILMIGGKNKRNTILLTLIWVIIPIGWAFLRSRIVHDYPQIGHIQPVMLFVKTCCVLAINAGKIFLPLRQELLPVINYRTLITGCLVILAITLVVKKSNIMNRKLFAFGLLWFLIFSLLPIGWGFATGISEQYEHRLYIPLIGILLSGAQIRLKNADIAKNKRLWLCILVLVLVIYSAKILYRCRIYSTPENFVNAAVMESPGFNKAYGIRAELFVENSMWKEAAEDYTTALKLNPGSILFLPGRGFCYLKMGLFNLAIEDFTKVLESDPDHAYALQGRAGAYYHLRYYEKAIADFDRLIDIAPESMEAYHGRGVVYFDMGKYEPALADFKKVLDRNGKVESSYLDKIYEKTGKKSEYLN